MELVAVAVPFIIQGPGTRRSSQGQKYIWQTAKKRSLVQKNRWEFVDVAVPFLILVQVPVRVANNQEKYGRLLLGSFRPGMEPGTRKIELA